MGKVGCACALQSSFLVLLSLLHHHRGCTIGLEIKKWPLKTQLFKQAPIHTYPQFPAKSKGSMTGIMLSFSTLRCERARSANILLSHPAAVLTETWADSLFHTSHGCCCLLCYFHKSSGLSLSGICNAVKPRDSHRFAPTSRGKSSPHPWDLLTQAPVHPDSLEIFYCCTGFCFSLWNPSLYQSLSL